MNSVSVPTNAELLRTEQQNRTDAELNTNADTHAGLYPLLDDPNFSAKISKREEFATMRYDGDVLGVEERAEELAIAEYNISPHQQFVRNFLSPHTPFTSLLLFHGLGSGKTCAAAGVCEEVRRFAQTKGVPPKIIVVANPNVTSNFKIQLFDKSALKPTRGGYWSLRSCVGASLIREVNPANVSGLSREYMESQIAHIISSAYTFQGYITLSNHIDAIRRRADQLGLDDAGFTRMLQDKYGDTLLVIDEVHNVRSTHNTKSVSTNLLELVTRVTGLRLLLMSATPVFNNPDEIVWVVNLMNANDRRGLLSAADVFDKSGRFKKAENGAPSGRDLLIQKATGYVSYVRGENPYTFPFRVYPDRFAPERTFRSQTNADGHAYPTTPMNRLRVLPVATIEHTHVYLSTIGDIQSVGYEYAVRRLTSDHSKTMGYSELSKLTEALNIIYPHGELDRAAATVAGRQANLALPIDELVGRRGLSRIMDFIDTDTPPKKGQFSYKEDAVHLFAPSSIQRYSAKIHAICEAACLPGSGVALIYSNYLDGGLVPMALALEERGFKRYGATPSLFNTPPTGPDAAMNAGDHYVLISGDDRISPNNEAELKALIHLDNKTGSKIKVVLVSPTGSEGMDFKFIRQLHIMDPWYNLSRIEQIVGRAVRNMSHAALPFSERNVQIYLHATLLKPPSTVEAADTYLYRMAEQKAVAMGEVNRALKEGSVDCQLNYDQSNLTRTKLGALKANQNIVQTLANKKTLHHFEVGDAEYSVACDFMRCAYTCAATGASIAEVPITSEELLATNRDRILRIVLELFRTRHFFIRGSLVRQITSVMNRRVSDHQIYAALTHLVSDSSEYVRDAYGRLGTVINIGQYYLFQPVELSKSNVASIHDRRIPIDLKHDHIRFNMGARADAVAAPDVPANVPEEGGLSPGEIVLRQVWADYRVATSNEEEKENKRRDSDWYVSYRHIAPYLVSRPTTPKITHDALNNLLVQHIADALVPKDRVDLMNYLAQMGANNVQDTPSPEFMQQLKAALLTSVWTIGGDLRALIMFTGPSWKSDMVAYVTTPTLTTSDSSAVDIWTPAGGMDIKQIVKHMPQVRTIPQQLRPYVGFISTDTKKETMIFKIKDVNNLRSTGFRCTQSTMKSLGDIIESLGVGISANDIKDKNMFNMAKLCVIQEMCMRWLNEQRGYGPRWFVDTATAIVSEFEKREAKVK
jgi:hypothetical protein